MKINITLLIFIILYSCRKETVVPSEFNFNNNIHSDLPSSWKSEFHIIMDNLDKNIPVEPNDYFFELDIYAWENTSNKPYKSQIGDASGASISGNEKKKYMVLEIPTLEFEDSSMHRYSVIPHEYFHVYQMSLSKNFYEGNIELKWLAEGGAASFESIYMQQYYAYNYFKNDQNQVNIAVSNNPKIFENYDDSYDEDINYSSSVFMVLALSKELQKLDHSEQTAFRMIFKDFWLQNPTNSNWKTKFEKVFSINVQDFYESLSDYSTDINSVLPSEYVIIEDIFNN